MDETARLSLLRRSSVGKSFAVDAPNARPATLARLVTDAAQRDAQQDRYTMRSLDESDWATRALPSGESSHVPSGIQLPDWLPLDCLPLLSEGFRVAGDVAVLRRSEHLSRAFSEEARACAAARRLLQPGLLLPSSDPRRQLVAEHLASLEHARRVLIAARQAERFKQGSAALELGCIAGTLAPLLTLVRGLPWGVTTAVSLGAAVPFLLLGNSILNLRHYAGRWAQTRHTSNVTWKRARRSVKDEHAFASGELAFWGLVTTGLVATSGLLAAGLVTPMASGALSIIGVAGASALSAFYGSAYRVPNDVGYASTVFASDSEKEALNGVLAREEKRHLALQRSIIAASPWPRRWLLTTLSMARQAPLLGTLFGWQFGKALRAQGTAGAQAVLLSMRVGCEDRMMLSRHRLAALLRQQERAHVFTQDAGNEATKAAVQAAIGLQMAKIHSTAEHVTSLGHLRNRIDNVLLNPSNAGMVHSVASRWVGLTQASDVVISSSADLARHAVIAPRLQARADRYALRWSARHARHAGESPPVTKL